MPVYLLFGSAGRGLFGGGPGQGGYLEPEGIVIDVAQRLNVVSVVIEIIVVVVLILLLRKIQ